LQRCIFGTLFVGSSGEGINLTHQFNMLKRAIWCTGGVVDLCAWLLPCFEFQLG